MYYPPGHSLHYILLRPFLKALSAYIYRLKFYARLRYKGPTLDILQTVLSLFPYHLFQDTLGQACKKPALNKGLILQIFTASLILLLFYPYANKPTPYCNKTLLIQDRVLKIYL